MARRTAPVVAGVAIGVLAVAGVVTAVGFGLRPGPSPVAPPPSVVRPPATTTLPRPSGDLRCDMAQPEVVVGAPGAHRGAGSAVLLSGARRGLVGTRSFALGTGGLPSTADPAARFGTAIAMGDVDGDGCTDAVVLDRAGLAAGRDEVGGLTVLLGAPRTGITEEGAVRFAAGTLPLGTSPLEDSGDRVTRTLEGAVLGDFDGDGCDDLALTVDVRAQGPGVSNTLLYVVPGGRDGLLPALTRGQPVQLLPTGLGAPPLYGVRLSVGDVDADGTDDLAITAGTRTDLLRGSKDGLDGSAAQQLVETRLPGVDDETLTAVLGDFDGDGHADLAVASATAGLATTYPGGADGLDDSRPHRFSPGAAGVPGGAGQAGFGLALAAGDLDGDHRDELVLGGQGSVWVLPGSASGTTGDGALLLTPATLGSAAPDDTGFGAGLAVGDFGGGPGADLLVADPRGGGDGSGSLTALLGGPGGLRAAAAVLLMEGAEGVPGPPVQGDAFGVLPR